MTTKQAFEKLINTPRWHELSGINVNTARSLKRHYFSGKISMDKQFELLQAAGYFVKIKWKAG